LTASCIWNIRTKNYQNFIIDFEVTVKNIGDVFRDTVYILTRFEESVTFSGQFGDVAEEIMEPS